MSKSMPYRSDFYLSCQAKAVEPKKEDAPKASLISKYLSPFKLKKTKAPKSPGKKKEPSDVDLSPELWAVFDFNLKIFFQAPTEESEGKPAEKPTEETTEAVKTTCVSFCFGAAH